MVQKLINQAISQKAQELHLTAGQQPMVRQDGKLQQLVDSEVVVEDFLTEVSKILLNEEEQQILEQKKSVVAIKEISSLGRFKASVYYQKDTLAITMKLISTEIPKLGDLHLPDSVLNLSKAVRGLIVISGPFDSGRSTLATALLQNILDTRSVRVMTLEQPLEYLLKPQRGAVEQRQVGHDVDSVIAGLDLMAEEDVEVIYSSSVETKEEVLALTKLALADRLVIVILDSDSAVRSLETLITLAADAKTTFVNNIADALQAVVNLRLLPKQGMPGRVFATEVLLNTPALRLALRDGDFTRMHNVLQTSRQEGMITLDQSLLDLITAGLVSAEAALQVAHDIERMKGNLR